MTLAELQTALADSQKAAGRIDLIAALTAAGGTAPPFGSSLLSSMMVAADVRVNAPQPPQLSADGLRLDLTGTADVLNLAAVPVELTFMAAANGGVDLQLVAQPPGWSFAQTFPDLVGEPIDSLALAGAALVFTSKSTDRVPWRAPDGSLHDIALSAPLTLIGSQVLAAPFVALGTLLGTTPGPVILSGAVVPPANGAAGLAYPELDLAAPIEAVLPELAYPFAGLKVRVRTPSPWPDPGIGFPIPEIAMTLPVGATALELSAMLLEDSTRVVLHARPPPGQTITPETVVSALLDGTDYRQSIPDLLKAALSAAGLRSATFHVDLHPAAVRTISVDIAAATGVTLGPVSLDELVLRFEITDPGTSGAQTGVRVLTQFTFLPSIFRGVFTAEISQSGDSTCLFGGYQGSVTLGALLGAVSENQIVPPAAIADLAFSDFGATFTHDGSGLWDWTLFASAEFLHQVEIAGVTVSAALQATAASSGGVKAYRLVGGLEIGEQVFNATLDLGGADERLTATWQDVGRPLGLADIAGFFGWDMPALPEGLDLGLEKATLYYDFTEKALAISAESTNYGTLVFASFVPGGATSGGSRIQVVALEPPWSVSLTDLQLIGAQLPSSLALTIGGMQVLAASAPVDAAMAELGSLFASVSAAGPVPKKLASGVTLAAQLQGAGQSSTTIVVPLSSEGTPDPPPAVAAPAPALGTAPPAPAPAPPPPAYQGAATWFAVDKTVGPATIRRVGIQYQDQELAFLLDASLAFGSLAIGLDGLGIASPLTRFAPSMRLSGLSVAFSAGPVEVAGGLLDVGGGIYAGDLTVKIDPYLISATGAFGKVDGEDAFFVFAEIEGEFGGPPAFFITGFMAGLGHNYALTLPAPDQVHAFPFLSGMDDPAKVGGAGAPPLGVLASLTGTTSGGPWLTPTVGAKWIAAGVDFRSFELIFGRVLVAATDGKEFEIAMLGLAHMTLPKGATSDAYAYVELQLDVSLKPDEGSFSAIASLTPNSYLLTHDCHLTGGFAFCLWFGDNPHAGDFVVTAGGYHPAFTPPSWYPRVARVGFNWAVSGDVTVKGGAYFALTPTAAMAGGSLEVLYESGDLKAWLTAYANLMVRWKPFYFTAGIGVSVGASYRLNLLFTTVTVSAELSATIDLYGPPTGGQVHVHWSIISFTVSFGADQLDGDALTLDWTGFRVLLPRKKATAGDAADSEINIHINRGLVRQDAEDGAIVRADELILTTQSAVPSTELHAGSRAAATPSGARTALDIRPMHLSGLASSHAATLRFWPGDSETDVEDIDLAAWGAEVQTASLPAALWGAPLATDRDPPATADLIAGLQTGLRLTAPPATEGTGVGPLDPAALLDPLGGGFLPLDPARQVDTCPVPAASATAVAAVGRTLGSPAALSAQIAILAALDEASKPPTAAPLTRFAAAADRLFAEPPLLTGASGSMSR